MPTITSFISKITAPIVILALSSCSQSNNTAEPEDGRIFNVSLTLGGEYATVTELPLARAAQTPAKHFGINVLRKKMVDNTASYAPYAYGVFDDASKLNIKLPSGYYYKFVCTTLTDDGHQVARIKTGEHATFMYPFSLAETLTIGENTNTSYYPVEQLNRFTLSSTNHLNALGNGKTTVRVGTPDADGYATNKKDEIQPSIMRYYGELSDYQPTADGSISISLKNASFGVKVIAPNIPDGSLTWKDKDNGVDFNTPTISADGEKELTRIFTFSNVAGCYTNPGSQTINMILSFTWNRESGMVQTFDSPDFDVKRNILTVVNLNLRDDTADGKFNINEETAWTSTENIYVNPTY